ncbi:MAG: NAD(P)/FAD-dependent oxidoreductase [Verrucomicrobiota bacterium]
MIYDAVIIGGGPGGSTTASYLARAGRKVLLLEKEHFPRFHIGESLLPYNMGLFEEMGILPMIEKAGFMVKNGAQFALGNGRKHVQVAFAEGSFNEHGQAFQVERSRFDELLLRHAGALGAAVREGVAVEEYEIGSETVRVQAGGESHEARFLIDASGTHNLTGNREGLREAYAKFRKLAIYGHFKGVPLPEGRKQGDIIIVRLEEAWFWMIPLAADRVSVGLVVDQGRFREAKENPEAFFRRVVSEGSLVSERMAKAEVIGKWHTVTDFSYRNKRFVSDRLIRVGDAAAFLDPIFSSGVYMAMVSGKTAAGAVDEALAKGKSMVPAMVRYEKNLQRGMALYWDLIEKFYTKPFIEMLVQPEPYFRMPCALNSVLAGRLDLPLAVRLRLKLFFTLVWLQQRFPIVPRLRFS